MARIDHAAIAERARQQLGLITWEQLQELGLSHDQVRGLTTTGALLRMRRGVYALAAHPASARQRLLAVSLAAPGAVASHLTAAWVLGFDGVWPSGMEIAVPDRRNPRLEGVTVHRPTDLLAVDTTVRGPQPVTTAARTLIDIAPRIPAAALEEAFDGVRRRNQLQLRFLEWRLAELRRQGRPGVAALEALLHIQHTPAQAESWLESAFLRLLRDAFLPPPRIQVVIEPGDGNRRRIRLDGFYDDQHLVVEVSGHATHATRRQRQADAERRARLTALGLHIVEFTYEDVTERPVHVAETLTGLLGLDARAA